MIGCTERTLRRRPLLGADDPLALTQICAFAPISLGMYFHYFAPVLPAFFFRTSAHVTDALLLVRIRFSQPPDVSGDLTDKLAIDARHGDVCLFLDGDVDTCRYVEHDRVRVSERKDHLLAP